MLGSDLSSIEGAFVKNGLAFYLGPVLPPRADGSPLENTSANVNCFLPKLSK